MTGTAHGPDRAASPPWTITALDTGSSLLEKSILTYMSGFGEVVRIPRVMWVLRGPTTVVVDTSIPMGGKAEEFLGEEFTRTRDQEPANALRRAGIDPLDVELVILTHLHWDHAGNCALFPEARVLVQRDELRYASAPGRFFAKSFLSALSGWERPPYLVPNLDVVDGATELLPGLSVIPTPGHTPGSQAVIATTPFGRLCIAGDAVNTYENVERDLPPGFHVNVDDSVDSLDRLQAVADVLLPSHDYEVFTDGPTTEIGAGHAARGRVRRGWPMTEPRTSER